MDSTWNNREEPVYDEVRDDRLTARITGIEEKVDLIMDELLNIKGVLSLLPQQMEDMLGSATFAFTESMKDVMSEISSVTPNPTLGAYTMELPPNEYVTMVAPEPKSPSKPNAEVRHAVLEGTLHDYETLSFFARTKQEAEQKIGMKNPIQMTSPPPTLPPPRQISNQSSASDKTPTSPLESAEVEWSSGSQKASPGIQSQYSSPDGNLASPKAVPLRKPWKPSSGFQKKEKRFSKPIPEGALGCCSNDQVKWTLSESEWKDFLKKRVPMTSAPIILPDCLDNTKVKMSLARSIKGKTGLYSVIPDDEYNRETNSGLPMEGFLQMDLVDGASDAKSSFEGTFINWKNFDEPVLVYEFETLKLKQKKPPDVMLTFKSC